MQIQNPFEEIAERLSRIEDCLIVLKDSKQSLSALSDPDQLLTIKQAAEYLNLSVFTLYGHVHNATIPVCKRPGTKRLYFSKKEIIDWVKSGRKKTVSEISAEVEGFVIKRRKNA